jgi:PAS domain S-box-containing protein
MPRCSTRTISTSIAKDGISTPMIEACRWPAAGGEMADRIRAHDWAATPLGPIAGWPQSLRTAVEIVLGMPGPATILWGPSRTQIYNDAYIPIARHRHPSLLGCPAANGWPDAYAEVLAPLLTAVDEGRSTKLAALSVMLNGPNGAEERVFDSSWSPIRDETGAVAGALETLTEVTAKVRADAALRESEGRQRFLLALGDAMRAQPNVDAITTTAARLLGERLNASRVLYAEFDHAAGTAHIFNGWFADGAEPFPQSMRLVDYEGPVLADLRAGRAVRVDDTADPLLARPDLAAVAEVGVKALLSVPLIVGGELMVNLSVHQHAPRRWTDDEVALVRDVAERLWADLVRVRAEASLRKSEEQFREFAENSADAIWIIDAGGMQLEYLSPAFERIWGRARDEVFRDIGVWAESVHPEDRSRATSAMPRLLAGEVCVIDYRIMFPDGQVRWIRDTGFPIRDDGTIKRVGGIAQDITGLKRVESEFAASETRWRTLATGIPQLVWRAGEPAHWTWASPQWCDYTGQTLEQSLGLGWLDPVHAEDRERVTAAWAQASERGLFEAEYRIRNARLDRYCWFQTRAAPVRDDTGAIVEWLGTSTDIDQLRRLQQRQQLLLAELQHRVRNTLGIIKSIARRTAESSTSIDEMSAHLDGRIEAFARVQAAVTRDPEGGVDLQELIEGELRAHAMREGRQIEIRGPKLTFNPRAAESISLAVHELTANGVKHGALGSADGRLIVRWTVEAGLFRFNWKESGTVEPVQIGKDEGFGMELLLRSLPYDLDAKTAIDLEPTGLRFTLTAPTGPLLLPSGTTGILT